MKYLILVPFRLQSTRLRQKVLQQINGKTLANTLCSRLRNFCLKNPDYDFYVATDSMKIKHSLSEFSQKIYLTSKNISSGSSRVFSLYQKLLKSNKIRQPRLVINLQGDMPFFDFSALKKLIRSFELDSNKTNYIGSLSCPWPEDLSPQAPENVKVVRDKNSNALYFSRSPIPWNTEKLHLHIGLYAYSPKVIRGIKKAIASKHPLTSEKLEQLSILYSGLKIRMTSINSKTSIPYLGIDTKEDLLRLKKWLKIH